MLPGPRRVDASKFEETPRRPSSACGHLLPVNTGEKDDGRYERFEVKSPAESTGAWDYYELLATTPADQAFRPLEDGGCAFLAE